MIILVPSGVPIGYLLPVALMTWWTVFALAPLRRPPASNRSTSLAGVR